MDKVAGKLDYLLMGGAAVTLERHGSRENINGGNQCKQTIAIGTQCLLSCLEARRELMNVN